jgi:hypothetical protein
MQGTKSLLLVMAVIFLLGGCSTRGNILGSEQGPLGGQPMPPQPEIKAGPVYLDFNDVLVPGELKRAANECYLVDGFGRLVLSGRVDGDSLAKFFKSAMPTTGWQYLDEYKYQGAIKLFFSKPDKFSSVHIMENPMDTKVEIWVTPLKPH